MENSQDKLDAKAGAHPGFSDENESDAQTAETKKALLAFLQTFDVSTTNDTDDLSDGVLLFECLSILAPEYFDSTTIARHLGDNWALKSSNLRKLTRNLEQYYSYELKKTTDWNWDISKMAKEQDDSLFDIAEFVVAAACTGPEKSLYVSRIMELQPETQVTMKDILQRTLAKLHEVQEEDDGAHDDENEIDFEEDDRAPDASLADQRQLQRQLESTQESLKLLQQKYNDETEESQKANDKLQAIVADLQDRINTRNDELIQTEEELSNTTIELQDAKSKLNLLEEEKATLVDDLDVYKDKAQKLYRAEAQLDVYKKKLEQSNTSILDSQTDQTEKYLQTITELEMEVKKISHLQKTVQGLQQTVEQKDRTLAETTAASKKLSLESEQLKSKLTDSELAKKLFQDELSELQARQQVVSSPDSTTAEVQHAQVLQLQAKLSKLEAENAKINSDKTKLEAYTKRTLSKFQDKYLVALQECKAKLKEKQDKIELLEKRSMSERKAQKREERLLSSTIYELGLNIMQTKLKSEAQK